MNGSESPQSDLLLFFGTGLADFLAHACSPYRRMWTCMDVRQNASVFFKPFSAMCQAPSCTNLSIAAGCGGDYEALS